jgi:hypothetical protein
MEMGSDKEMGDVREIPESGWWDQEVQQPIEPGRLVRVRSGILEGMEGVVVRRVDGARLLVALPCLQQGIFIRVEEALLDLI